MSEKKLNWGLLSTARINRHVIPVIKSSRRNQLVAVASRTQETADAYAKKWEIGRAHGSYEALLDDPEVEVVYISLPNQLHAEWTIKTLQAGKHVLCEKPLALTLEEVDAMAAAARESGRVLAEAFMYRHHPQTINVKDIVNSGVLGTLQFMRGAYTYTLGKPGDIRVLKETGGGSVWDVGCYPISYARMIAGADPLEAFGWQVLGPGGVDEIFAGQLRFGGDLVAHFDSSFQSPLQSFMEIVGSHGVLSIPRAFTPGVKEKIILRRGERTDEIEIIGNELYSGEVEDMADAVLEGKTPRISLADSRGTVATILAVLEAARQAKPVSVPR